MNRLLVANRGEIALRIFRACRDEGIATVAVVAPTTEARSTPAPPTRRSRSRRISTRRSTSAPRARADADAVHPGYGFLAESAEFAEAVIAARA